MAKGKGKAGQDKGTNPCQALLCSALFYLRAGKAQPAKRVPKESSRESVRESGERVSESVESVCEVSGALKATAGAPSGQ